MHPDLSAPPAGEELYDHRLDLDTALFDVHRFEFANVVAGDPTHAAVLAELRGELVATVAAWQRSNATGHPA
jgi:hypothetical protein